MVDCRAGEMIWISLISVCDQQLPRGLPVGNYVDPSAEKKFIFFSSRLVLAVFGEVVLCAGAGAMVFDVSSAES